MDVVELKWINTWEFEANDVHVYVNWVEVQPTKTLSYDTVVWWTYRYILTLTNLLWDGDLKIAVHTWSFTDTAWNPNKQLEWISNVVVDNTIPTCTISQDPTVWTNEDVTLTLHYDEELNQITSWYSWSGNNFNTNKTKVVSANGTYTWYVIDAAENVWSCSKPVSNIDTCLPQVTLTTTDDPKVSTQILTWTCTDTVWVTQYYIWSNSTPAYVTIQTAESYTTWINITAAWTYYMYCMDAAGNVVSESKTYDSYTVNNMLENITWTNWSYNTNNYTIISSGSYIAPRNTELTLANIYTIPQYASLPYKWYSTWNTVVTPNTSSTTTLNGNTVYYAWFDRERYTLDLIINTWIDTIYYKVNGAETYTSTKSTLENIVVKAWSTNYAYATPKSGYTYTDTNQSTPWNVLVTWDNVFSPVATANTNTQYIVYHYVKNVWGSGYTLTKTEPLSWTTDQTLTLSSLAKIDEFLCASYDKWSLTWSESWPWEIVEKTTIKWDWSTRIYLFYNRNTRKVVLSGDEHVDHFEWDGTVLECGSERQVEAVPKPWYHFVRWDKEYNRKSGEDENEEPALR